MTDSLADLLKRQQLSSTPKAPEAPPPHDEAAEVAAIAKQQAAKAAVIAGRFLGKATVLGTKKTIEATQQAKQRLDAMTPEQRLAARQITKRAGLVVLALAGLTIIGWGGTKAWQAWHTHHTATAVEPKARPAEAAKPSTSAPPVAAVESGPYGPKPITVQARMPDGTIKEITILPDRTIKTVVVPETAGKPVAPQATTPPVSPQVEAKPSVPATAVESKVRPTQHGVNAQYHHTAPVLNQQKYQPDSLLAPRHKENWFTREAGQPNPVAKQRPVDPQEQQNMQALDQFFNKLNKEKPATQGNTNGSNPTHP